MRRLPVVEDGHLLGIVTLADLARRRDPGSALAAIACAEPALDDELTYRLPWIIVRRWGPHLG